LADAVKQPFRRPRRFFMDAVDVHKSWPLKSRNLVHRGRSI
jgi:hypothetical protein